MSSDQGQTDWGRYANLDATTARPFPQASMGYSSNPIPFVDRRMLRKGILKISLKYLSELLSLPEDAVIEGVFQGYHTQGVAEFVISSPNLPETLEGSVLPHVTLQQLTGFDE